MYIAVCCFIIKCLLLSDFNQNRYALKISVEFQILNFMKISVVGDALFHADDRLDVTRLIVVFWNCFANVSKIKINWLFLGVNKIK